MSISPAILRKTIQKALAGDFISDARLDLDKAVEWATSRNPASFDLPAYPHHYIIVRTDFSVEQQLVQAAHAAYEAGSKFGQPNLNGSMVMCAVPDEDALVKAGIHLLNHYIPHVVWSDTLHEGRVTSIGTAPLLPEQRQVMKRYKCWSSEWSNSTTTQSTP
jgi:hypothetical protein